ncbi:MAG: hypothetical protein SFZ23_16065 [Planctomycetota bacterium]|nr:hypothetical protein [Planctomycetota bacterium]
MHEGGLPSQPGPRATPGKPACEQCGYLLAGLTPSSSGTEATKLATLCPECGTAVDLARPWLRRPAPPLPVLGVQLIGPLFATCTVCVLSFIVPDLRRVLFWPALIVWASLLITFGGAWPWVRAKALAAQSLPISGRRSMVVAASMAAWGVNLTLVALTVFLVITML